MTHPTHMVRTSKGFTLVELLVVISIISLLSSVVISSTNAARAKARDAKRLSDIKEIQKAIELYRSDNGSYPRSFPSFTYKGQTIAGNELNHAFTLSANSCSTPTTLPECGHCNRWCGLEYLLSPYLSELPRDPLGNNGTYQYAYASNSGNGGQTYGLSVTLETMDSFEQNDGGFFTGKYEVGPQVVYCMQTYTGGDRNWFDDKQSSPGAWANVCKGGN